MALPSTVYIRGIKRDVPSFGTPLAVSNRAPDVSAKPERVDHHGAAIAKAMDPKQTPVWGNPTLPDPKKSLGSKKVVVEKPDEGTPFGSL